MCDTDFLQYGSTWLGCRMRLGAKGTDIADRVFTFKGKRNVSGKMYIKCIFHEKGN